MKIVANGIRPREQGQGQEQELASSKDQHAAESYLDKFAPLPEEMGKTLAVHHYLALQLKCIQSGGNTRIGSDHSLRRSLEDKEHFHLYIYNIFTILSICIDYKNKTDV